MSDNSFPQGPARSKPRQQQHTEHSGERDLDLGGQLWKGPSPQTELAPTAQPQLSSPGQGVGDWGPASASTSASSADSALSELCQFWYNTGWQQGAASQGCSPYQAMPGAQAALPAASPQLPLQTNTTASPAGYNTVTAQDAWWPQQGQLLNPPESGLQSLPPAPAADLWWGSTGGGLLGPSGADSDHDHRNKARCRCTYNELLIEAFRSNLGQPLSLKDVYQWFETNTHIPTSKNASTWKMGIRRNLASTRTSKKYRREGDKWVMRDPT
ncbi:hypothetical protein BKA56DRAFT_663147 [Ilyonectria sp. MPI-CAGE-AT-0026]|nr:hypothetical protein BKA56DRAFT_663147 [Ilyonectria sp. MPI-CAGE-AT-0026]